TVVYVTGQDYSTAPGWHITVYQKIPGYVRMDQLRKMTEDEVQKYLASGGDPTKPTNSGNPYDPYAKSSYGYVTNSGVNFRSSPNGSKLKSLNKYAFALVLGTKQVNGITWY
ncbi:MAG: hypothetical protein RSA65_06325, partial [Clostridia bacterium]